jgi:predicted nucleic acid-binding protein
VSVVVADTSPLNYVIQCEAIDVLPRLYQQVVIPQAVFDKLNDPGAPASVRRWIQARSPSVVVRSPARIDETLALGRGLRRDAQRLQQERSRNQRKP